MKVSFFWKTTLYDISIGDHQMNNIPRIGETVKLDVRDHSESPPVKIMFEIISVHYKPSSKYSNVLEAEVRVIRVL